MSFATNTQGGNPVSLGQGGRERRDKIAESGGVYLPYRAGRLLLSVTISGSSAICWRLEQTFAVPLYDALYEC